MIIVTKYRQLIVGMALGAALAYSGMRIEHHLTRLGENQTLTAPLDQPAEAATKTKGVNELQFSKVSIQPTAKLGQVTVSYDFIPANGSFNAVMQLYIDVAGTWEEFTPSDDSGPIVFQLYKDLDCTGSFKINLPKGSYSGYRMLLFDAPDGKSADFNHTLWDSVNQKQPPLPKFNLDVLSSSSPITSPVLTYPPNPLETPQDNGLVTVTIPAIVKYPSDYQIEGGGFWAMAKGSGGFSQVWVDPKNAISSTADGDSYCRVPISFVMKDEKPGVYNLEFGLFKQSFGNPIQWIYPGMDFEVGGDSWVAKAAERRIPPRLHTSGGHFVLSNGAAYNFYADNSAGRSSVKFIRGGNYGNAITWTAQPALDTPGYFTLLGGAGCHYIRFNFNPDRYLNERMYQDSVDQVVENIWAAGLYPIIAPQDLPTADTLEQRIVAGDRVLALLATKYAGKSVWIEECNEPHEFATWSDWKPVAERYLKTIRSIDPGAFVIVPFESWSKDGNGAAQSPITDDHVDLYDGHAYIDPQSVATMFGAPIKAGLPVMIGEYGSDDPDYLHAMDHAFQALTPAPVAISPWAFTIKGQDSIPLVEDGTTANLVLTSAGKAIATDFERWDKGQKIN